MGKQNHTPLLNQAQIATLARDLGIPEAAVRLVLQAAGHELRERYRNRGWLPAKKDPKWRRSSRMKKGLGLQQQATKEAYREVRLTAQRLDPGQGLEVHSGRQFLIPTDKEGVVSAYPMDWFAGVELDRAQGSTLYHPRGFCPQDVRCDACVHYPEQRPKATC